MKYKVIFDTNSIRNAESVSDFLGGRADLERFLKVAEIIIPDLVIEEIKTQKRRHLISKRDSFLSNPFHILRKIDEKETKDFNINKWILELADKEKVPYTVISLSGIGILEKIKNLCLENLPPFEQGSDKGFKDAYIYFTILEYLNTNKDKNIFLVTRDELLREALLKDNRIKVIKNFDEFDKNIDDYFRGDYFISRLKEEVADEIVKGSIEDIWLNTEGNWLMKIICTGKTYFVEVDFSSREIIDFNDFDFSTGITALVISRTFRDTHLGIDSIKEYIRYFSDEDIQNLLKAATENDQIYSIAEDEDVREFFMIIYKAKSQIISEDVSEKFKQYFKII